MATPFFNLKTLTGFGFKIAKVLARFRDFKTKIEVAAQSATSILVFIAIAKWIRT